jgi:hypothetical protein
MRRVIEAVWNHYASLRKAGRERRKAEEEARLEALEQVREIIPCRAYEAPAGAMDLSTRAVGRLEDAGLVTAGEVMERLIADGDEGLLELEGIGPKTVEYVKEGISELGLLEDEPVSAEEEVTAEEEAHLEALEQARAIIPGKAYETPVEAMDLGTRAVGLLEDAGLVTAGEVMERLIADGDEGLLELEGIGPKTVEHVKASISELGLLEGEPVSVEEEATVEEEDVEEIAGEAAPEAEEEGGALVAEEVAVEVEEEEARGEKEVEDKAAMLERAMRSHGAEGEAEEVSGEEEPEYFFEEEEPIDREEKLKRERVRRVQLIFDEETGELIPRRRRKREEGPEDWSEYLDF